MALARWVSRLDENQYVPFIAGAVFFGLVVGFPLGLTLAHAAAQEADLGGRFRPLVQVHGHLQLMGWGGLFVMGMGLRLVPRFTGVRVRPVALVPLTFVLMASGLALRAMAQPFADEGALATLFVLSAALEAGGALAFCAAILRCVALGRREAFLYTPFFAAGAVWVFLAAGLSLLAVIDADLDRDTTIAVVRSGSLTFVQLYGFVLMFIFAVSLRTFPIFFGRPPAQPRLTLAVWASANVGVGLYTSALMWKSYDVGADVRVAQTAGFLLVGAALLALLVLLRIFEGRPHRLRPSARRTMQFVRSAYAWLLVGAGLQVFFSLRAFADGRPPGAFETDAVRHFLAVGFMTTMIFGMALLVLPRLAMRRVEGQPARLVAPVLLALLHGATAARGAGSLLADEMQIENGYWTMSAGGVLGVLAMAAFAVYLLWPTQPPDITLSAQAGSDQA